MSRVSFALALVASVAAASTAGAADLYGSNAAPAASYGGYQQDGGAGGPAQQWTGAYAGGQIGYGWGKDGMHGAQGGIFGGVQTAVGANMVVGGEAELNINGQSLHSVAGGQLLKRSSDWNGAIRARAGVAFDRVMPYGSVGVVFVDDTAKGFGATASTTKVGYMFGAGVEGKVNDKISLRGELNYVGVGNTTQNVGGVAVRSNASAAVLRTGAAYKF